MIQEEVNFLVDIKNEEWGRYAFSRDPLKNKIENILKEEMIRNSIKCGKEEARKIRDKYGKLSIKEIIKEIKIDLIKEDSNNAEGYLMFACYNSPNKITIYEKNKKLSEEFIKENKISSILKDINLEDILIAHELFHYIEEKNEDIYTRNTKVVLWKIGPFKYKSGLVSLSEIAAMVFAKELFNLKYNPYIFDVVMLYPHNEKIANELYKEIEGIKGGALL